jgi:hypothetical protein
MVSAADRSTSRNRRIAAFSARECLACSPNLRHCQAETRQCAALRGEATAPAYPDCIDHCLIGRETETDDNDEKTSPRTLKAIVFIDKLAEREGFEPSIRFCRILTFQASAFDHSATAPHFGCLDRRFP